jgi:hypothetical protein
LGIGGISLDLVSGCEGAAGVQAKQRRILDRDTVEAQWTEWPSSRAHSIPMESNALWAHALAHIHFGKPRKSDVSDLRIVMR